MVIRDNTVKMTIQSDYQAKMSFLYVLNYSSVLI